MPTTTSKRPHERVPTKAPKSPSAGEKLEADPVGAPCLSPAAASAFALQRSAGNRAVSAMVAQRRPSVAQSPQGIVGGSAFQAELRQRVAATPQLGDKIPEPDKIQEAGREAAEDAEVLKVAQGRPSLAAVIERNVSEPTPGAPAQEATAAPMAAPGRWARFKAGAKSFAAGVKDFFTPTAVTKAKMGNYAETGAKGGYAATTTGSSVLGQAGNLGAGLAAIGQNTASAAVAASPAVAAIAHIVPIIGIFLAPITMCLNGFQAGKAWDRAARLEELIQKADGTARDAGHPPEIVAAVRGAMEQKYDQAGRKAKMALASALSLTGGLLLLTFALASNPVGWAIGVALATIGGVYGFYCSARAIYRMFKKKNKGEKRKHITAALIKGMKDGDPLATQAVRELGLNPETVAAKGGDVLLFARLTTG